MQVCKSTHAQGHLHACGYAGYPFKYLYDESQEVAKAYKAACTPEFYLADSDLQLYYHGQFDGSRPSADVPVTGKLSSYFAMIARHWFAASVVLPLLFAGEAAESQLVLLQEMTFEQPLTALSNSNHLTGRCSQAWAVVSSGILANNLPQLHSQALQPGDYASTTLLRLSHSCMRGLIEFMPQL